MPRGVAVPEARQQLFAALERVMAAEGPLTSRGVTQEAGVATGLLFAHFRTFDKFLVAYAVDRSFQIAADLASALSTIGHATVAGTLTDAILALPRPAVLTLIRLTALRPSITTEVAAVLGPESAGLRTIAHAAARYLDAEQQAGRVPASTDTTAVALAVAGVVLTATLTEPADPAPAIRRAMTAVVAGPPGENVLRGTADHAQD